MEVTRCAFLWKQNVLLHESGGAFNFFTAMKGMVYPVSVLSWRLYIPSVYYIKIDNMIILPVSCGNCMWYTKLSIKYQIKITWLITSDTLISKHKINVSIRW